MARLNLKAIEGRIKPLAGHDEYDREFIFDFMLAYGRSKGNITRLRNGSLNIAEDPEHEVAQKNVSPPATYPAAGPTLARPGDP